MSLVAAYDDVAYVMVVGEPPVLRDIPRYQIVHLRILRAWKISTTSCAESSPCSNCASQSTFPSIFQSLCPLPRSLALSSFCLIHLSLYSPCRRVAYSEPARGFVRGRTPAAVTFWCTVHLQNTSGSSISGSLVNYSALQSVEQLKPMPLKLAS